MSWQEDYFSALQARDRREHANKPIIDAYTKLADRTAAQAGATKAKSSGSGAGVVADKAHGDERRRSLVSTAAAAVVASSSGSRRGSPVPAVPLTGPPGAAAGLQADLAEAQAARAELQGKLERVSAEHAWARTRMEHDEGQVRELQAERAALATKLRDRDAELRGKAKLLDDVQNDAVSLNLQLTLLEEQNDRLKAENKELVDRWMARMGQEADKMNLESKFS